MRAIPAGGCRPSGDQLLLLRAALLGEDAARSAWARWREGHTIETADHVALRLFPLVYRNLERGGIDEADLSKLRGAYRAVWLRNQVIFDYTSGALRELAAAGIPTLVLKGVALALLDYRDPGVRAMSDGDLLVPWREADRAHAVLARAAGGDRARAGRGGTTPTTWPTRRAGRSISTGSRSRSRPRTTGSGRVRASSS